MPQGAIYDNHPQGTAVVARGLRGDRLLAVVRA